MPWEIIFSERAASELKTLPHHIAMRILDKVRFFANQRNPLQFAKKLTNFCTGTYRFRIGDYRVIFDVDRKGHISVLNILLIKHRKDVYR